MFCPNCGKEILDNAAVCLGCGISVKNFKLKENGKVSSGWWWLGFFIPIAGLLIWIFCNDNEPKKAKKAGIGALVGVIVSVALVILVYLGIFVFAFMFGLKTAGSGILL